MSAKPLGASLLALLAPALPACGQATPEGTGAGKAPAPKETPALAARNAGYARLLKLLYRGTVPLVSPAALARELRPAPAGDGRPTPAAPLLLDARTPAEFKVSHLRGAQFLDFGTYQTAELAGVPRSRPVVVYCSVGYRSERVGERLRELGFTNVRNLYGGIFEWVNLGLPVVNAQGPTKDVHPYSALWGTWLEGGRKEYGAK